MDTSARFVTMLRSMWLTVDFGAFGSISGRTRSVVSE